MIWHNLKLGKVVEKFISGGTPSRKEREYWNGDIPWITGADIMDDKLSLGRRYIKD